MTASSPLRVKIFADGADKSTIARYCADSRIAGFTTNPTLMRKAGVTDYEAFAREVVDLVDDRPVSFEVFSDDFAEMERQALHIASWGANVAVKIPITNTRGDSAAPLLRRLSDGGVRVNATAILSVEQVRVAAQALSGTPQGYVSVFAGRIADSGRDPLPLMREALAILAAHPGLELIWASPREVLNIVQADAIGCHVITVTSDLLEKMHLFGKDLAEYSLETVRMFHDDARRAGYFL
ncbi:MAG: transaldolase [Magnetospirillum sp. WYHS-4]